jgi:hypothetical protein
MATIIRLNKGENYNKGYINLYGSTGKCYRTLALDIPGYGMIPCSMKLRDNFTNTSDDLIIVMSDENDLSTPVTSHIWVTRKNTNVVRTF